MAAAAAAARIWPYAVIKTKDPFLRGKHQKKELRVLM
jgi:hypothetical protein